MPAQLADTQVISSGNSGIPVVEARHGVMPLNGQDSVAAIGVARIEKFLVCK
jgi:hypothetical protein